MKTYQPAGIDQPVRIRHAAALADVAWESLYKAATRGRIETTRDDQGYYMVTPREVQRYLNNRYQTRKRQ